jgi:hypothetical protein
MTIEMDSPACPGYDPGLPVLYSEFWPFDTLTALREVEVLLSPDCCLEPSIPLDPLRP